MAYFRDFSEYIYHPSGVRPGRVNVGWLDAEHEYERASASSELLDLLWECCKVSVVQMRGIHECQLCGNPPRTVLSSRNGERRRLLGSAEIRVFGDRGLLFAAPNLIYHYVRAHYSPPKDFVLALKTESLVSSPNYVARIKALNFNVHDAVILEEVCASRTDEMGSIKQFQRPTHYDND